MRGSENLIGSTNFGKRSVYRDLESQIAVITTNKKLKANLIKEAQGSDMLSMCSAWNHDTMEYSRVLFVLCAGDSRVSRMDSRTLGAIFCDN